MSLEGQESILSHWYEREKESVEIIDLLVNLGGFSADFRSRLEKVKKEDQRHASFIKERLRQFGVDFKVAEVKKERLLNELQSAINDLSDEEKIRLLIKTLRNLKKDKMRLFQDFLDLKTSDVLTSELLERINISESSHLLSLEALDLRKIENNKTGPEG